MVLLRSNRDSRPSSAGRRPLAACRGDRVRGLVRRGVMSPVLCANMRVIPSRIHRDCGANRMTSGRVVSSKTGDLAGVSPGGSPLCAWGLRPAHREMADALRRDDEVPVVARHALVVPVQRHSLGVRDPVRKDVDDRGRPAGDDQQSAPLGERGTGPPASESRCGPWRHTPPRSPPARRSDGRAAGSGSSCSCRAPPRRPGPSPG